MYKDLNSYKTNTEDKIKFQDDSGSSGLLRNTWVYNIWESIKVLIRFKITKWIFFSIVSIPIFLITGDLHKTKNLADEVSTQSARDDYFGLFNTFARESNHKSIKLNLHPVYHTKEVKKLENEIELKYGYPVKFSKLFAYVMYEKQDFLVMKKSALDKNGEKLKLELSTVFGTSANDHCDDLFDGFIMDDDQMKVFIKNWRVSKIKDELTQDNDDGMKNFRCVIGPDTIDDFLEKEADND